MELMNNEDMFKKFVSWSGMQTERKTFQCGYCGNSVDTGIGKTANPNPIYENETYADEKFGPEVARKYWAFSDSMKSKVIGVFICPHCNKPTFIDEIIYKTQFPLPKKENNFHHIPSEIHKVYQEAIDSYSAGAFTGTTLLCRKLLMSIAVNLGAKENQNFAEYVKFLDDGGYITKTSRNWVDLIRTIGNKATHDLDVSTQEEAEKVLTVCEMILKINYEYPSEISNDKDDLESKK